MTIQSIEVKLLSKSKLNVRKTDNAEALDELKASILAHGLMQNLVVVPAKKGKFQVIAGARRLAAIQELIAEGKLSDDTAVPCTLTTEELAEEQSLAENNVRLAMHPADQLEAFAGLSDKGQTAAQIAQRFGVAEALVLKRLKLGRIAPELLAEYRNDEIDLDCLQAFSVTDDQKRQVEIYRSLQGWQRSNAHHIRSCLTKQMIEVSDKLAKFVGIEAYEAAGGRTRTDLFGDRVYLEDTALLQRLTGEKLEAEAEKLRADGWGWVVVDHDKDYGLIRKCGRIQPVTRQAPDEHLAELEAAEEEQQRIAELLDETDFSNEDPGAMESLEAKEKEVESRLSVIEAKLEAYTDFLPLEKKLAGCFVSIGWNGKLDVEKGLVKTEDKKAVAQTQTDGEEPEQATDDKPDLSQAVIDDLKAYRTQVAQVAIAENPMVAFDLLVMSAARQVLNSRAIFDGPHVSFQQSHIRPSGGEKTAAAERLDEIKADLPLSWMRENTEFGQVEAFKPLAEADKHRILAYCVAMTLRSKLAPAAGKQQSAYDAALAQTGVDVTAWWRPTAANFLSRIKIGQLLEIGRQVFLGGDEWVSRSRDKKKAALVTELDAAFAKSANPDTVDKIREWLPEGMALVAPKAVAGKAKAA